MNYFSQFKTKLVAHPALQLHTAASHQKRQIELAKRQTNRGPAAEDGGDDKLQAKERGEGHLLEDIQGVQGACQQDLAQSAASRHGPRGWRRQRDLGDLRLFVAPPTGVLSHELASRVSRQGRAAEDQDGERDLFGWSVYTVLII